MKILFFNPTKDGHFCLSTESFCDCLLLEYSFGLYISFSVLKGHTQRMYNVSMNHLLLLICSFFL